MNYLDFSQNESNGMCSRIYYCTISFDEICFAINEATVIFQEVLCSVRFFLKIIRKN